MNDSYHFTRYKQLLFTKGPAKLPRAICVPTLRDKLTASVLNELLVGVYGDKCKTRWFPWICPAGGRVLRQSHQYEVRKGLLM